MERASRLHREDYEVNRDFYYGGPDALKHLEKHPREDDAKWAIRRRRLVGVNVCAVIVDKIVSAEYGYPATRDFGTGGDVLADEFAEIAPQACLHRSRIDTARQRAIDGVAVIHLYWDAEASKVAWKHERPEHVFPVVAGDYDKIDAIIVDRSARAGKGGQIRYLDDATYPDEVSGKYNPRTGDRPADPSVSPAESPKQRLIEVYTHDEAAVVKVTLGTNGKIDAAERVEPADDAPELTQFGCLPFVFFHGKRLVGDLLGCSTIRGVTELNAAINREVCNLDEIIGLQTFSLLVLKGDIPNLPVDEKGFPRLDLGKQSFVMVGSDGDVFYADPNPKIAEALDTIIKLIEMSMAAGRVPMVVAMPQQDHAESGVSRQIQFLPLIDLITELETYDALSEREFVCKALLIGRRMAGGGGGATTYEQVDAELEEFRVDWSENFYPTDETSKLEVYQLRRDLDLESRRAQLKRENPDLDDVAIDALIEEIDDEKEADVAATAFQFADAADADSGQSGDNGGGKTNRAAGKRRDAASSRRA